MLATSATPVFGIAVLQPLLGNTSAGTVGLVALAINLVVPAAIILLEIGSSADGAAPAAASSSRRAHVMSGLKAGLSPPLLWAPILGIAVVVVGLPIPKDIASCLDMIGAATLIARALDGAPLRSDSSWRSETRQSCLHGAIDPKSRHAKWAARSAGIQVLRSARIGRPDYLRGNANLGNGKGLYQHPGHSF